MHCKLQQNRKKHVKVEDVAERSLAGELLDGLDCQPFVLEICAAEHTFAREMHRKQTLISIPVIVTW